VVAGEDRERGRGLGLLIDRLVDGAALEARQNVVEAGEGGVLAVVGKVLAFTPWPCRKWMIGAPFSSFGISAALTPLWAVKACWNSLSATFGVQVPAGLAASFHPEENFGARTAS